jgi:hypothetical protein
MVFDNAGALFVLADTGPDVRVWDTATGDWHDYTTQCQRVGRIVFVPATSILMVACFDGRIVTVATATPIAKQSAAKFNQFTATKDGKLFIFVMPNSAPFFVNLTVWDSATRKQVPELNASSIAFSPIGNHFSAGNHAGIIDLWTTDSQ